MNAIQRLLPIDVIPKSFSLYRNYRLPLPVARFVQYVGVDLDSFNEKTYKSEEREMPRVLKFDTVDNQLNSIVSIIKNNTLTDVGILVPHNDEVKTVSDKLRALGVNVERKYNNKENFLNSEDSLNFSSSNPKVMTYHSAKGLQFETVFLPMVCNADTPKDRKPLYVAMTRTCRNLYIMYSGMLPTPLNIIPQTLYKTSIIDEVEDI